MATRKPAVEISNTVDAVDTAHIPFGYDAVAPVDAVNKAFGVQGFTHEELESITSWEQAIREAANLFTGGIINAQEYEAVDKEDLIDKPFLILSWEKGVKSDYRDGEFVIVKAITPDNKKILFTDGSTGIRDYLFRVTARTGRTGGVNAVKGLRVSKYGLTADDMPCDMDSPDRVGIGATYYLN
jgi:hypothetical protein